MHVKTTTSYAIRLLLYLATSSTKLTSDELGAYTQIAKPGVIKVMQRFKKMGWVIAMEGLHGGYIFTANPDDITLLQVFQIMDNSLVVDDDLETASQQLSVRQLDDVICVVYQEFRSVVEKTLGQMTLSHLIKLKENKAAGCSKSAKDAV